MYSGLIKNKKKRKKIDQKTPAAAGVFYVVL